jgi:hypothetical protein
MARCSRPSGRLSRRSSVFARQVPQTSSSEKPSPKRVGAAINLSGTNHAATPVLERATLHHLTTERVGMGRPSICDSRSGIDSNSSIPAGEDFSGAAEQRHEPAPLSEPADERRKEGRLRALQGPTRGENAGLSEAAPSRRGGKAAVERASHRRERVTRAPDCGLPRAKPDPSALPTR